MIDFELTDEQKLIRETARDFSDREIAPRARENDRNEHFDTELVKKMADMGTSLEGSTEDILRVVGELHAVPFDQGVPRVYTVLKLDERRDRPDQTLDDKVRSVEHLLGEDELA